MADPANPGGNGAGDDKELPKEDNIRVVCRFRPLNDSETRTGSKFVVKFPDDQCASISVIIFFFSLLLIFYKLKLYSREKCTCLTKCSSLMLPKNKFTTVLQNILSKVTFVYNLLF